VTDRPRKGRGGGFRGSLGFWCALAIAVMVLAYVAALAASRPNVGGDTLRLDGFFQLSEQGRIQSAEILDQDSYVVGDYEADDGQVKEYNTPYFKSEVLREQLANLLLSNEIPTRVNQQFAKSLIGPLTILLPALILVVIFIYFILSWRRGTGLFGVRSGARRMDADAGGLVTFDDVAGQEQAVTELREVSDFLSDPDRFASLGAQIPRGLLLYGPPGCGKTLMARALAGEAGAEFYSISGSDFVELYVGVGAARVRDLFKEARENAPAIVFIDELDAVGRRRVGGSGGGAASSSEEQNQALNQLLAEIDGFNPAQGVIVIGATNRPDVLDPALLRPGRFDRAVGLELPDEEDRLEILKVHARSKALADDVDLEAIAERAVGMTGADLASVMNEAALQAGRARKRTIAHRDLEEALTRIREAPERQRRLSMRDRRIGQGLLEHERVTFEDVAGADEAIEELEEVREYLADPARFEELGARIPRGYLIAGPPGTGKTLLARALAGEANAAFISASATEFVEVYVGEGAARVRDLFAQARSMAPAIVFIDEIDSIGGRRSGSPNDHSERQQTLNQLLVELDSGQGTSVIAMAATNRPDVLDPALVRQGRFDRTIELDLPDRAARVEILKLHAQGKRLAKEADLDSLAGLTRGLSGAELAGVMNEAALLAARREQRTITQSLLEEALERVGMGIAGRRGLSEEERRLVAYHEAGHGLVARALPGGRVLHKISIVGRGGYLGTTWLPDEADRKVHSRSLLIERMATLLGGRAAERIVFGELGDGAASDLAAVGRIARDMVTRLGMSDALGAVSYPDDSANGGAPYSEETSRLIDGEARKLVSEAEQLADGVLSASRQALDRVAEALLDREILTLDEVEEIAGPPPRLRRPSRARTAS
jgi:ATP-dependent metalloprotease FtsH